MKYLKMLALTAVAAGALMAFIGAGTASATVLCSTTADPCPFAQTWPVDTTLHFTIPSGSSASLTDTAGEPIDTCSGSTVHGAITSPGSATTTVTGHIDGLTWESCTFPTKTLTMKNLEVHKINGTSNGTVTADGQSEVTINTVFFGSCIYGITSGESIGDLTEGKPAVFHADAIAHKLSGSNLACPATAKWKATYTLTSQPSTTLSVATTAD